MQIRPPYRQPHLPQTCHTCSSRSATKETCHVHLDGRLPVLGNCACTITDAAALALHLRTTPSTLSQQCCLLTCFPIGSPIRLWHLQMQKRCSGAMAGEGPAAADPSYPQPPKQALDWTRAPRWDTSMHSLRASRHTDQQRDNRRTLSSSILKVDAPKLGTWLAESKLAALETVRLASTLGLVHSDVIGLVHTREAATDMCNTNWQRRPSRIPLCLPITRVPANS